MDIGSILLILGVMLLAIIYISIPLLSPQNQTQPVANRVAATGVAVPPVDLRHSTLLAKREHLLKSLQDLETDYALGKIPADDYPQQRSELLQAGAVVLQQLDELKTIEVQPQSSTIPDSELEILINERRRFSSEPRRSLRPHQEKTNGFCYHCGKPVQSSDQFCSHCGADLTDKSEREGKK